MLMKQKSRSILPRKICSMKGRSRRRLRNGRRSVTRSRRWRQQKNLSRQFLLKLLTQLKWR
ncbi:unnamed protein product [Dibothriocephalus latus]|uniref:Uncharacterized protein n=1 Tax=Dibothriocephalus latus TaxID=60516 RepID=A0A3P7P2W4_DIBLA|nr:unnamed protein product [Dibothriocephalus latus]